MAFLTEHLEWEHLLHEWKTHWEYAPSPALFVSRAYLRFEKNLFADRTPEQHGQKFDTATAVAKSFSDGVEHWTQQIPELDPKLVFQLHLEGLKNNEISSLLQISIEEISLLLNSLKSDLKDDLQEGGFGT